MTLRILLLLVPLLLAGCASLTTAECRGADWREIGREDGAEGRAASYIEQHAAACADAGIVPDRQAWLRGRAEGVRLYCTPQNAYAVGRRGRPLSGVCEPARTEALLVANQRGREYHRLTIEMRHVLDEIRDAYHEAAEQRGLFPGSGLAALGRVSLLDQELRRLRAARALVATP